VEARNATKTPEGELGKTSTALLHAQLGNGYRVRGSPLSFRPFATICDNNGRLPEGKTISKATAASRLFPFFVGWLSSRAGSAGVSYPLRWLGARGLDHAVRVPLCEQHILIDCAVFAETLQMS